MGGGFCRNGSQKETSQLCGLGACLKERPPSPHPTPTPARLAPSGSDSAVTHAVGAPEELVRRFVLALKVYCPAVIWSLGRVTKSSAEETALGWLWGRGQRGGKGKEGAWLGCPVRCFRLCLAASVYGAGTVRLCARGSVLCALVDLGRSTLGIW